MAITHLVGNREDLNTLCILAEKYFNDEKDKELIPEDYDCKVTAKLWPVKGFTIEISKGELTNHASILFQSNISEFAQSTEVMIKSLVESIQEKEKSNLEE